MIGDLPQHDECDTDEPLVAAMLGIVSKIDDFVCSIAHESRAHEDNVEPLAPFDFAVLGLLSVRRTLANILSVVAGTEDPSSSPSENRLSSLRPRDILR